MRRTLRCVQTTAIRRVMVAALASAAAPPAVAVAFPPAPPDVQQTRVRLERLTVAPAGTLAGYNRERFGGDWASTNNGCDVRERVLIRDGRDVLQPAASSTGSLPLLKEGAALPAYNSDVRKPVGNRNA